MGSLLPPSLPAKSPSLPPSPPTWASRPTLTSTARSPPLSLLSSPQQQSSSTSSNQPHVAFTPATSLDTPSPLATLPLAAPTMLLLASLPQPPCLLTRSRSTTPQDPASSPWPQRLLSHTPPLSQQTWTSMAQTAPPCLSPKPPELKNKNEKASPLFPFSFLLFFSLHTH